MKPHTAILQNIEFARIPSSATLQSAHESVKSIPESLASLPNPVSTKPPVSLLKEMAGKPDIEEQDPFYVADLGE
ncbi:hypothetical protein HDU91_003361, partial [Kappamyces sp. JEL0680]